MIISISTLTYTDDDKAFELRKDVIHPVVKAFEGCQFCKFGKSTANDGEYVIIIGWDTEEHSKAFDVSMAHDILKEHQWPLMDRKIVSKQYDMLLG